ncbi:Rsm22-domain-containing protein [Serendipita vermifera]|nr:Rsm22-domain-containing protein [Serendipita vermifera]
MVLRRPGQTIARLHFRRIHTTSHARSVELDSQPMKFDDSYQRLLQDVNLSIALHSKQQQMQTNELKSIPEHDVFPVSNDSTPREDGEPSELLRSIQWKRKSPAARLGSDRIGQFKLPFELVTSMQQLIEETDKYQLRSDAKRLLTTPAGRGMKWIGDTPKYSSSREEIRMGSREGLAYAAITLPGQFAAIRAVLHEIKTRMSREWTVKNVLDFGSQTGAAFWACLTFFGKEFQGWENQDTLLNETSLKRYIGFDNRHGLVTLAKKIARDKATGDCVVMHKQFWSEIEKYDKNQFEGDISHNLAISAFALSQIPTPAGRKRMVKEMWESGADTMVIIDQGTKEGFTAVTDAREYLLQVGNADESQPGVHVVAPCPHDGACPLRSTPDICNFPQRFIRPEFQKKTKHAKRSYEDTYYSYVVIQRGRRPEKPLEPFQGIRRIAQAETEPAVTEGEISAESISVQEHEMHGSSGLEVVNPEPLRADDKREYPQVEDALSLETERQRFERKYREEEADETLKEHLRQSSYHWRRTVYSPMKGSGHITLDTCTPQGNIARIVIPKSQGKQVYYDARKASWGDLFPHDSKHKEVIRKRGVRRLEAVESQTTEGDDPMATLQQILSSIGGSSGKIFKETKTRSREKLDKTTRRENHQRRKAWRKQEEHGYS